MKKRLLRRMAAALTAVVLAVLTTIIPASAWFTYAGIRYPDERQAPSSSNTYATETAYFNGQAWYPNIDAYYQFNTKKPMSTKTVSTAYSSDYDYFNYKTGEYVLSNPSNSPYIYRVTRFVSNSGSGVAYKNQVDNRFYPSADLARAADSTNSTIEEYPHRGDGNYFNIETGRYYKTLSDAIAATRDTADFLILLNGQWYNRDYTEIYYNTSVEEFFPSEAAAKAADPTGSVVRSIAGSQGYYLNRENGVFYMTAYAAAYQSTENDVTQATSFGFANGYYGDYANYNYAGMPLFLPAAATTPSGTVPSGTTPATPAAVPSTSPYDANSTAVLSSTYNYTGWVNIAALVDRISAGANMNIYVNSDTYVSSTFMKAVAGRDINVTLINSNGSRIGFNGLDIYTVKDMPIAVTYNSRIPADIYDDTIRRVNPDSASSFSVGTEVDLGAVVKLYIPFNSSRADYKADLYLYDSAKKTTSVVDSRTVGDDGATVFEIRRGGQYIACLND